MNTADRVKKIMSAVFEVNLDEIDDNCSVDTVENWDSLRHLNLILALEDEFEISLPDEEVGNMNNFKLIEIIINEQLSK